MIIPVVGGTLAMHGRLGNSYLIPVKGLDGKRLPLPMIEYFCRVFLDYARTRRGEQFSVAVIGGGKPSHVAPFFDHCPSNIYLPYEYQY
jgi:hypothetical protein